jgi:hypothetical protein
MARFSLTFGRWLLSTSMNRRSGNAIRNRLQLNSSLVSRLFAELGHTRIPGRERNSSITARPGICLDRTHQRNW